MRSSPAIVSAEQWATANAILEQQADSAVKLAKQEVHLFTGVLRCGCGSKMYLLSNTPKYVCSACRRKIHRDDLEALFRDQLHAYVFNQAELDQQQGVLVQSIEVRNAECQGLRRKAKEVEGKLSDLLDLLQRGEIAHKGFGRYHDPLFEQLTQLQKSADEAQADVDLMNVQQAARNEALSEARSLYDRWAELHTEEKRRVIEIVVESIVVEEEEVVITLAHLSPLEAEITDRQRNHKGSSRPRA